MRLLKTRFGISHFCTVGACYEWRRVADALRPAAVPGGAFFVCHRNIPGRRDRLDRSRALPLPGDMVKNGSRMEAQRVTRSRLGSVLPGVPRGAAGGPAGALSPAVQEAQLAVPGAWPGPVAWAWASHFLKLGRFWKPRLQGQPELFIEAGFGLGVPWVFVPNQCVQARLPHISLFPVLWTKCPSCVLPRRTPQAGAGCGAGPSNELPGVT